MPLMMPRKTDAWDGLQDAALFPAEDVGTRVPVSCAIAAAALTRHFGGLAGNIANLLGAFRRYRPAIEQVASKAYDARGKPDVVTLTVEDFIEDAAPSAADVADRPPASKRSVSRG